MITATSSGKAGAQLTTRFDAFDDTETFATTILTNRFLPRFKVKAGQ
ncbi:hypothetical protein [Bradyrhizobium tropiciagri]|nr:hypothetical protein [Bradyrhizobium tropiciagri]